jgi:hypothetical protein
MEEITQYVDSRKTQLEEKETHLNVGRGSNQLKTIHNSWSTQLLLQRISSKGS